MQSGFLKLSFKTDHLRFEIQDQTWKQTSNLTYFQVSIKRKTTDIIGIGNLGIRRKIVRNIEYNMKEMQEEIWEDNGKRHSRRVCQTQSITISSIQAETQIQIMSQLCKLLF